MKLIFCLTLSFSSYFLYGQCSYYPSTGVLAECNVTYTFYKAAQYDYDFRRSSNGTYLKTSVKISINEGKGTILVYWYDTGRKDKYVINFAYREKETSDFFFTVEGNSNLLMKLTKRQKNGAIYAFELMSVKDNSAVAFFNN